MSPRCGQRRHQRKLRHEDFFRKRDEKDTLIKLQITKKGRDRRSKRIQKFGLL